VTFIETVFGRQVGGGNCFQRDFIWQKTIPGRPDFKPNLPSSLSLLEAPHLSRGIRPKLGGPGRSLVYCKKSFNQLFD
jgi:hypothetical protein